MRKVIRKLVDQYKKKAKLENTPTQTIFRESRKTAGTLRTVYDRKTKKLIKFELVFPVKIHRLLAKVDAKQSAKYTNFVVAHEVGHLRHNVNQWDNSRKYHSFYGQSPVLEKYANHFAAKITGISTKQYRAIESDLVDKYNAGVRAKKKNRKP